MARPFETEEVAALLRSRRSIETLAPRTQREWETKRSAGGRYDIEYLTAIGLAAATPGDDYEFSLDTPARLETLRDKSILDDAGYGNVTAALSLFTEVEYLMELQEFSLPRSDERSRELERYLSRSFEYWNSPKAEGVANALTGAKTAVRSCFDRFMALRA